MKHFQLRGGTGKAGSDPALTETSRNSGHREVQVSKSPATESKTTELFPPNTVQIFSIKFLLSIFLFIIFLYICVRACVREHARLSHGGGCSYRGQRTTCGRHFSSHLAGSRDRTQVSRLGGKRLSLRRPLTGPAIF